MIRGNYGNLLDYYILIFSLVFNVVTFLSILYFKTSKPAIYVSSFNDISNTSVIIWFTGGPYSFDIFWYFTLILGLIVLVETKIGLIVAIVAFFNIAAVFYASYHNWFDFKQQAQAISFEGNLSNLLSVFIILIIISFFATKKDLYEEEIIVEKDLNINNLESELELRLLEINKLRADIARDFHDVMGNKLASIANISQMLTIKSYTNENFKEELIRINALSKELYSGTKDFIWTMDINNNSLYNVYFYLKDFADSLFEFSNMNFLSNPLSNEIPDKHVSQLWSSQIILITKEILTNSLIHSKATEVEFTLHFNKNNILQLSIIDNGVGFDFNTLKRLNGIKNVIKRADSIGCTVNIESEINKGSCVKVLFNQI